MFLPVTVAACFFRTFDDDQGLQEQWPPLAERARRESGELHLPPLDTELTGRTQEHAGRKVRNPIVLTPPARIKKKSEISSPIELIRSVRSMRNVDTLHIHALGAVLTDFTQEYHDAVVSDSFLNQCRYSLVR